VLRTRVLGVVVGLACLGIAAMSGSAGADVLCPNAGLRGGEQAAFLPDCRAFELVSPPEKNGGDVSAMASRTRAAVSGDAVQFVSMAGFGDVHGTDTIATEYLSERGANGWGTHGIAPAQEPPAFTLWWSRYQGEFSDDLSTGVFFALSPLTDADPNVAQLRNLYLRRDLLTPGVGDYQLLTGCTGCTSPLPPTPIQTFLTDPAFAGASTDFRHVIFESPVALTPDVTDAVNNLGAPGPFLYESVDGHVRTAGILPDGSVASQSAAGMGAFNADPFQDGQFTQDTISADGSRIVFTAGPFTDLDTLLGLPGVTGLLGDLYMRVDGSQTIQLNQSEASTPDPAGHQPALYGAASRDGSKVFFMTPELLTDDSTPGGGMNLYMYDLNAPAGHHLTLLTQDSEPADDGTGTSRAEYVIGTSQDGSYVYFWGTNGLLPGQGTSGIATKLLYVWHGGTLRLIGSDGSATQGTTDWGENGFSIPSRPKLARVSPDGRHIAFATALVSMAQSVGYDNTNPSCGDSVACREVYLYDYGADHLTCVSCDPSGALPLGNVSWATLPPDTTTLAPTAHLNHPMSADGQRVFFDTPDPLVSRDTNGKRDVYEYDATTGQVSLISTGRSSSDSLFADASPSGNDVFFTTRQQLVGIDTDQATDLYDARVNGGIAAQSPPPTVECSGVVCHGTPPQPPPPLPLLGVTFQSQTGGTAIVARIHVLRRSAHGSTLAFVVRVPAAGRIGVRGALLQGTSRSVSHGGSYRLRVRLTAHARRLLAHRHVLRVRVRVSYRAADGQLASVVVSVRVKG
jgi:Tol biopolymer transport system component